MASKKTLAFIGVATENGHTIVNRLAQGRCRLLLVTDDLSQTGEALSSLQNNPVAEIEIADCARDGCWEADIIILAIPFPGLKELIDKIREVATQKVVLYIPPAAEIRSYTEIAELESLLPFSKITGAYVSKDPSAMFIAGRDKEAVHILSEIFTMAGYSPVAEDLDHIKTG